MHTELLSGSLMETDYLGDLGINGRPLKKDIKGIRREGMD
jgi:hypothetical protein